MKFSYISPQKSYSLYEVSRIENKQAKNLTLCSMGVLTLSQGITYLNHAIKSVTDALDRNSVVEVASLATTNKIEYLTEAAKKVEQKSRTIINDRKIEEAVEAMAKDGLSDLDAGGYTILLYVQRLSYWLCAIACIIQLSKRLNDGDINAVLSTLLRYAVIFASMFGVLTILNIVWRAFFK